MGKLIIEKDRHIMAKEPHYSAMRDYIDWFVEQPWNNENNDFLSLGDFFHKAYPEPAAYELAHRWLAKSKFRNIYIIAGNHDFRRDEKTLRISLSIDPLGEDPRVVLIKSPQELSINNWEGLCLPFIYKAKQSDKSMQEFYAEYLPTVEGKKFNHIFYHFEDEQTAYHKASGVDLSNIKGTRCGGHVHLPLKNYPLGMPVNHRYDERGQDNNLLSIDTDSLEEAYIEVPKFLDYHSVDYPNDLPEVDSKYQIWNVNDCSLDRRQIKTFYENPKMVIREINKPLQKVDSEVQATQTSERLTIEEWLEKFKKEKSLSDKVFDLVHPLLKNREMLNSFDGE